MMIKRLVRGFAEGMRAARKAETSDFAPTDLDAILAAPPVAREDRKLIFSFTTGRSGQRWLTRLLTSHENCTGGHERFPRAEPLYRYVHWHKLPIDLSGYHHLVRQSYFYDWSHADISLCASPYHCFGVDDLVRLHAPDTLLFHLREPVATVASFLSKGWYGQELPPKNTGLALGLVPALANDFHYNFSRITPHDDFYEQWAALTQVGRIAWFCSTAAESLARSLKRNSGDVQSISFRIEDIGTSYEAYDSLAASLGIHGRISQKEFLSMRENMSNKLLGSRDGSNWSAVEKKEFEAYIAPYDAIYKALPAITGHRRR